MSSIVVQLEKFEGPLALLLHLIRKSEMDIYDIEIHKITEQYLAYIKMMKELNLEVAGDFVAMAATLIHIKSKMLLPQYDEDGLPVEEDPRQELVSRLLEYERYQQAGKTLYDRQLLGREVFARGFKLEQTSADPTIILDEGGLFAMIGLYRRALKKVKKNVHVVMEKTQSLSSRILELRNYFIPGQRIRLDELVRPEERTKPKWVITFLSVLELGRMGFVSVFQSETYGPIHIDTKKTIERDVVSQVQELEAPEIQALDLNTQVVTTGPVETEIEPEAASDAEIEEAERQMELAEQTAQSEELAGLLENPQAALEAPAVIAEDLAVAMENQQALDNVNERSEESVVSNSTETDLEIVTDSTVTEFAEILEPDPGNEPEPTI